ncbi:hypothetical protein NL676_024464 [Syzygium grande]|nr:hypothetical protein NL676_024464 [Syzygium grande]
MCSTKCLDLLLLETSCYAIDEVARRGVKLENAVELIVGLVRTKTRNSLLYAFPRSTWIHPTSGPHHQNNKIKSSVDEVCQWRPRPSLCPPFPPVPLSPPAAAPPAPPPSAALCRPLRVSASCATSTAERPGPRPMAAGAHSRPSSLYEVLGIRAGATGQEIKSAYRRLARVLHPDVAAGAGAGAGREFIRVHEAYATLSDPDRRADYDRTLFQGAGRFAVSAVAAAASARGPSRNWETDQCW